MTKYFFIDYDNTLFSHRTMQIPGSALSSLLDLQKAGHKVIIASGRGFRGDLAEDFGPDFVPDGLVSANGAVLEAEGKLLKETYYDLAVQSRVIDFVLERGYCLMGQYDGEWYVTNLERLMQRHTASLLSKIPKGGSAFEVLRDKPILSFFLDDDEAAISDLEANFPELKLLRMGSELGGADVIPGKNGKAGGMEQILEYFGASCRDAIAIGDSMNDIEMLRRAGLGIAMGNAMQEVREAADYVTEDIDRDGLKSAVDYALAHI